MLIIFTRAIIIYIFLLIIMRIMGKKQLGELQPFEFTITLIVADLACIPMGDTTVPITYGLVPIFTLLILQITLTKLIKHSIRFRRVVNGKPIIVINENGIDTSSLRKLDMTINDIFEAMRTCGYFNLAEIRYAIIETNGTMTVMPKAEHQQVTLDDLAIEKEQPHLPYSLICEGKMMDDNILKSGFGKDKVEKLLSHFKLRQKDIIVLTVTGGEDIYIQAKNQSCIITSAEEVLA